MTLYRDFSCFALGRSRRVFVALLAAASLLVACGKTEGPAPPPAPAPASGDTRGAGGERIALLIGNGAYPGDAELDNPTHDAEDYGAALKRAGFKVEVKTDLDRDAMFETIKSFGEKAKAIRGIALFYFAGHGMALHNTNYLLPVSIKPDQDDDSLSNAGIDANTVVRLLGESAGRVNVAIFDMCRSLPSRGLRGNGAGGLVRMEAANGSLLAFATQFGAPAKDGKGQRNSPYARQLIAALDTPGLTVTDYFGVVRQGVREGTGGGQVPEETNRLEGLAPPLVPGAGRAASTAGAGDSGEVAFWNSVKDSGRAEELKLYLERYPNGQFAGLARVRMTSMEGGALSVPVASVTAATVAGTVFQECEGCPEMVVVPKGRFKMGSPESEAGRYDDEGPRHEVRIAYRFAVGKYEVTRGQFGRFVRETGRAMGTCKDWDGKDWVDKPETSWEKPGWEQDDNHPALCVSWEDAKAYVDWLSRRSGKAYRLPSEAEWEYAARAGTTSARYWGESADEACQYANARDQTLSETGRFAAAPIAGCRDGYVYTAPVGKFRPNAFGLYDMIGNAQEWVEDLAYANYQGAPSDGSAWVSADGKSRVARGGGWSDFPRSARSAIRHWYPPGIRPSFGGFRVARTLP